MEDDGFVVRIRHHPALNLNSSTDSALLHSQTLGKIHIRNGFHRIKTFGLKLDETIQRSCLSKLNDDHDSVEYNNGDDNDDG